jgi:bifunctional ADP-heptose synthase (sugar kinase/adenylyltransferase)
MIITIASPDKLSISMFLSFMRFCLGKEFTTAMTQSLWSPEALYTFIDESLKKTDKLLFSYYAKGKIKVDPLKVIPEKFITVSDIVVWMDLYSTDWNLIKDTSSQTPVLLDRWKKNIAKMCMDPVH